MGIKNHTPGQVRYWTYFIEFPDGDKWVKSIPFVHDLQFELKNTSFGKIPGIARDILVKGEAGWKDQNGCKHYVRVDQSPHPENWGKKRVHH